MKKLEYLKLVLANKVIHRFHWVITAFSITKEDRTENYDYRLIAKPDGLYFITSNGEEKIDDYVPGQPLFSFKERIAIDSSFIPNCKTPGETTIGNILFNSIAILYPFGTKIEFQYKVNPKKIEEYVINNLKDTPASEEEKEPQYFYVDELLKFSEATSFIENLAPLTTVSATVKNIQKAPGIDDYRKTLLDGYGESIKNPNVLNEYEQKLQAYDEAWLKDDPANKKFLAGKTKNIGRKKMFLSISASNTFEESPEKHVIGPSLDNGYPLNKEDLRAGFEDLRFGSYGRAKGTVKGGVSMKYLIRATNTYTISEDDCGSIIGLPKVIDKDNYKKLIGRTYLKGINTIKINTEQEAFSLIGQTINLRSTMYCKTEGTHFCKTCCGDHLAAYSEGLYASVTELSSWILNSELKKLHRGVISTAVKMSANSAFS